MAEMDSKKWVLAVWEEGDSEEECVIPAIWVEDQVVRWPKGNAVRALNEIRRPESNWSNFKLVKIKFKSDDKQECEDYTFTTTAELTESEDEVPVLGKRKPKKKVMGDFVMNINEQVTEVESKKKCLPEQKQILETNQPIQTSVQLPSPPVKEKQSHLPGRKTVVSNDRGSPRPSTSSAVQPQGDHSTSQSSRSSISLTPRSYRTPRSRSRSRSYRTPSSRRSRSRSSRTRSRRSRSRSRPYRSRSRRSRSQSPPSRKDNFPSRRHRSRNKRSRSQSPPSRKDNFPMSNEKFQKRVLFLLTSIRDAVTSSSVGQRQEEPLKLIKMKTIEELESFEATLTQPDKLDALKVSLCRIGGVTGMDHTKKAMEKLLHNCLMAKMNLTGKKGKYPFGQTILCGAIQESVLKSHGTSITEFKIQETIMKFLKYAPERSGGGGRKE